MIHKVDHNRVVSGFQYSDTNSTTLLCDLLSTNIPSFLPIPKSAPLASSPTFLTSAPKTAENLAVLGPEKLFPHLAAGRAHCPFIRCHSPSQASGFLHPKPPDLPLCSSPSLLSFPAHLFTFINISVLSTCYIRVSFSESPSFFVCCHPSASRAQSIKIFVK